MDRSPLTGLSDQRRLLATGIVVALGLGLVVAISPFVPGLIGAPVLAVVFTPLQHRLAQLVRPRFAAALVLVVAICSVLLPAVAIAVLIIGQAPSVLSGPGLEEFVTRVGSIHIGNFAVGAEMANAAGSLASWASRQVMVLAGSFTRATINLLIAMMGLYYLLISDGGVWRVASRHLPFSEVTAEHLRLRFHSVTEATLVGIGVTAVLQGSLVAVAFVLVGISNPLLWGALAALASVLPVLGGSLVWLPATVLLALDHRYGAAWALAAMGVIVISNIDNIVRPIVFKRVSNIHPLVALVGVFAGVQYFGLAGALLGPLALAFFFELVSALSAERAAAVTTESMT